MSDSDASIFRDSLLGPRSAGGELPLFVEADALYRVFRAARMVFALPDGAVVEWQSLEVDAFGCVLAESASPVGVDGEPVPLLEMESLLPKWMQKPRTGPVEERLEVLVVQVKDVRVALRVEQVDDPVELEFEPPAGGGEGAVLGAKLQEDGVVVFILDPAEVVRQGAGP